MSDEIKEILNLNLKIACIFFPKKIISIKVNIFCNIEC